MIHIRELDHWVQRVADLNKMLHFYCDALGCTVERRQDSIGLAQLRAGRSLLDLVPSTASSAAPAAPRPVWRAVISITSAFGSSCSRRGSSAPT